MKIGIDDLLQSECSKEITELFKKFIEEKKVFVMVHNTIYISNLA